MAQAAITVEVEHHHYVHLDDDVKHYLRHLVRPVLAGITRLELKMTEISDFLDAEGAKADNIATALADVAADVNALLASAGSAGAFSPEEQAKADALSGKFDAISAALGSLDVAVGDQDGSDAPPPSDG